MVTCMEVPVGELRGELFSLQKASRCRFRFLDCRAFVDEGVIRILDFEALPVQPYATISYVWSGLKGNSGTSTEVLISVQGAGTADPIGSDVLKSACVASIQLQCKLLWLDRLCVMQETPEDKRWQIIRMYDIYKGCKVCIILAGGLARLGTLFEETSWIYRAWTLQEAMAPADTKCLFSWERGTMSFQKNATVIITEVEHQKSGIANLVALLQATLTGFDFRFSREENEQRMAAGIPTDDLADRLVPRMLADRSSGMGRNAMKGLESAIFEVDGKSAAIWRSAYLRTSSRAVDMVFSIMGLLGVSLDPKHFTENDRHGATTALLRELMRRGSRADWLGIDPDLQPSPVLSYLPLMPETSVAGRPYLKSRTGGVETGLLNGITGLWWLGKAPMGSITNEGFFRFSALSTKVERGAMLKQEHFPPDQIEGLADSGLLVEEVSGQTWKIVRSLPTGDSSRTHAVVVGEKTNFRSGIFPTFLFSIPVQLMLFEEKSDGSFFRIGGACTQKKYTNGWVKREFLVGGS
jgi:Heterokaryon incompatibility protein (HET)